MNDLKEYSWSLEENNVIVTKLVIVIQVQCGWVK